MAKQNVIRVYILPANVAQLNAITNALNMQFIAYRVLKSGYVVVPLTNLFYVFKKAGFKCNKTLHTYKKGYLLMP